MIGLTQMTWSKDLRNIIPSNLEGIFAYYTYHVSVINYQYLHFKFFGFLKFDSYPHYSQYYV